MRLLLAFSTLLLFTLPLTAIDLNEAITKGWVEAELIDNPGESSHFGQSIQVQVKNLSGKDLKLELKPGQFLMPADTNTQRMMVTATFVVSVEKDETDTAPLYAMCSEKYNSGPGSDDMFTLGGMAKDKLLKLANYLDTEQIQDESGQNAVWIITDGIGPNMMCGTASGEKLMQFFKNELNIPLNCDYVPSAEPAMFTTRGNFTLSYPTRAPVTLKLYDKEGELLETVISEMLPPNKETTYNYELNLPKLPDGEKYKLKMMLNGQVIREMEVPFDR